MEPPIPTEAITLAFAADDGIVYAALTISGDTITPHGDPTWLPIPLGEGRGKLVVSDRQSLA